MRRLIIFALFIIHLAIPLASGEAAVSVGLSLDRTEATRVDSVRVTVRVSGSRKTQADPVVKGLENFIVRQGGTSSRVEIINGKVTSGIDYTYYLQAKKEGTYKIGPAEVQIDGKSFLSQSHTLKVKKPAASEDSRGNLFLTAEISANEVYVEEQTRYVLKLYSRTGIRDISLNLPEPEHLKLNQLGKPRNYQTVYNGREYEVLEVRYAVVSSNEGSYIIGPASMNMTVFETGNHRRRSVFDDPFFSFSAGRPISVASDPVNMSVHPLPAAGKPIGFSGLVGQFTMESDLDPGTVTAGESATLTVRVRGQGNVQRIPDLTITELKDAKTYADQPVLNVKQAETGLQGEKTMKWALVPETKGRLEIPQMKLSFFNPKAKTYETLTTPLHILSVRSPDREQTVAAGPAPEPEGISVKIDKKEIEALGRDILPIHMSMKNLTAPSRIFTNRVFIFGMLLGPIFLYMVAFFTLKIRRQKADTQAATRSKKAARKFYRQCSEKGLSHQDLMDALRNYLNNRFSLSIGVLTSDEAAGMMRSMKVDPDIIETLRSMVQLLENAVYTGNGHLKTDQAHAFLDLVKDIEKEIR
jgi:hypothetical protein